MKMMKLALLGGAAFAVMTAGAQADDLSALKGEIEALNARVAQLEATPSVPAGYQLMTVSTGKATVIPGRPMDNHELANFGDTATIIGILPTADAPAATTVEWSGYARAALVFVHDRQNLTGFNSDTGEDGDASSIDVPARGQLKVVGKTETAVGEVGAEIQLRGDFSALDTKAGVVMNEAWGWWAMTPELTLGGGYTGSLGNIGHGYDGSCNCYYTDNADVGLNPGDSEQMRLSYASGPISFGIAIEDASGSNKFSGDNDSIGVAGEIAFSGDMISGEVSGVWHDGGNTELAANGLQKEDSYMIGAGVDFTLSDMFFVSVGAAGGQVNTGDDFWGASILARVTLSDAVFAEAAYGHKNYDGTTFSDVDAILAGIYYAPVNKLVIGLEGEMINVDGPDSSQVDLVTIFKF